MSFLVPPLTAATWTAGVFTHGTVSAEDAILSEVTRRVIADDAISGAFYTTPRIEARHALTLQDFGVAPRLLVVLNISAMTESPTKIEDGRLTVYLANFIEAAWFTQPVEYGYPTVASLLAQQRKILSGHHEMTVDINGTLGLRRNIPLVYSFEIGESVTFGPVATDKGPDVLVAIQPFTYVIHVDRDSGKIANYIENGGT